MSKNAKRLARAAEGLGNKMVGRIERRLGDRPIAEGQGRIRPRARLLRTIGAELISSEVVAVIELVRNSFDADASTVELVFRNPEHPDRAVLEIRDDGHGMTRDVLLGPWLEPATDYKQGTASGRAGDRSPGGRRRLGSKGVGRFAAQRLGEHLELRTRGDGCDTELLASFDWTLLEEDAYLDEVRIPWRQQYPEHIDPCGTHLVMSRLRDTWTPERFQKLKLGLARLVSPVVREQFRIQISINGAVEEIRPALDSESAMYTVEGDVQDDGTAVIEYRDLNGDSERWERTLVWPDDRALSCGPFHFRINGWDLDREPLKYFLKQTGSKLGLRDFRRLIRAHSGISLYRDGFRILPYGESDNDWLRLDRRRVHNPTMRLSNNQILGVIQLTADENPLLKDQTNREGLVANESYSHLQQVVLELLGYLETRRFAARRSMDIDWQRRSSALPVLDGCEADAHFDALLSGLQGQKVSTDSVDALRTAMNDWREATADAVRHYAGLAGVGQMSSLVFRQLQHPMRQIRSELGMVAQDLEAGEIDADDLADTAESVGRALVLLSAMEKRMERLDPLATGRRGRRVSMQAVEPVLKEVLDAFGPEFNRAGAGLDFQSDLSVKLRLNKEVVQMALANLVENALHFSQQTEAPSPIVTVELFEDGFTISDNGPGIPEALSEAVFEPHFTTRDDAHGLGLTLARDLVRSIGGRLGVEAPAARFRVFLGS